MTGRAWTIAILIATTLGLIGWDIYVALTPEPGDTISQVVLGFAQNHPVLPFAFGVLMGHFFWPQRRKPQGRKRP